MPAVRNRFYEERDSGYDQTYRVPSLTLVTLLCIASPKPDAPFELILLHAMSLFICCKIASISVNERH